MQNQTESLKIKMNISIPWRSIWSALGLIVVIFLGFVQITGSLIPSFGEIWNLNPETTTIYDINVIWPTFVSCLLISAGVCLFVRIFKPLKEFEEEGLILGLVVGLFWGLVVGLFWGLVVGLFWGLVMGLFWGLVMGLVSGLVAGLVAGLSSELKKDQSEKEGPTD
jgi:uncharacterized membrane protein